MKAARLIDAETFHISEEIIQNIENGKALVQVHYCGVCGSDLHAFKKAKGYEFVQENVVLGHEFLGTIIQVGDENNAHLIGKSVVLESQDYCNQCAYCAQQNFTMCLNRQVIGLHYDGGMAQYALVPIKNLIMLEAHQSLTAAYTLVEPISVGVHALKKLKTDLRDKNILVQGPGAIGLLIGLLCKEQGAHVWISGLQEDYDSRLRHFEQLGLSTFIQGQDVPFQHIDVLIECSGSANAIFSNTAYLVKGGTILLVALYEQESSVYFTPIIRNEWTIQTSYGSNPEDYPQALALLDQYAKQLTPLLSIYTLDQVEEAFRDALSKKILKAILKI